MVFNINYSFVYKNAIKFIELNDFKGAIKELKRYIETSNDFDDIALAYLNCGFINTKLKDYHNAVIDFSNAISVEEKIDILDSRSKDISFNARSNARYNCDDFKGAVDDKIMAKNISLLDVRNKSGKRSDILDYKKILLGTFDKSIFDLRYILLIRIARVEKSKYDLIEDYKKVINNKRKQELINSLELKSKAKYKNGDYKGSIKALRRSEKYYF